MRWRVLGLLLLLAGCASDGGGSAGMAVEGGSKADALAKIHTELAAAYFSRKQYGIALQEVDIALKAKSDFAPAFNIRGLIRMDLRENDKAQADFRRSLDLDGSDSNTHNNYGWFLCQTGREKESIAQFKESLNNPLYATPEIASVNAGLCSRKLGNMKDAEDYFQRALAYQPNYAEALYALADFSYFKQDYVGAKSYLLKYLDKAPEPTAASLWLGVRIERHTGDRDAEESYALRLRKYFPDSREAQLLQKGE